MTTRLRLAASQDLDDIYRLALKAGVGLTTLSKDKAELNKRIQRSIESIHKQVTGPVSENYLFVLEHLDSNKVVGTCAIEAAAGHDLPFYSYRVSKISKVCHQLNIRLAYSILQVTNDFQGYSEIGTLYLDPDFRHSHNGLLLSRGRFLFIGLFPERFAEDIIAEMRGISDKEGRSPFWDSVGAKFFKMSFEEADRLSILTDKQFIADLMPHNSIHAHLLSDEAQAVIGQPHESTVPAMKILEREGFRYNNYIDIFDAGPTIECQIKHLKTVRKYQIMPIKLLTDTVHAPAHFVSNGTLDFKAVTAPALINPDGVILSKQTAEHLGMEKGDKVQIIPVKS